MGQGIWSVGVEDEDEEEEEEKKWTEAQSLLECMYLRQELDKEWVP